MSDIYTAPGMMNPPELAPGDSYGPPLAPATPPVQQKVISREAPDPTAERRALVKRLWSEVDKDAKHWKDAFARIREDEDFVYKWGVGKQWKDQTKDDERYIANIVQRHIAQRVAALYAKNPTVVARLKKRRWFKVWDGEMETLINARMAMDQAAQMMMPPPPGAAEVLQDAMQGMLRKQMVRNVGETLEILFSYFMKEQVPNFKDQMKQLVLRTEVCGVGWVKLGYQRLYGPRADSAARIDDIVTQMQTIDRMRADLLDSETGDHDAEVEELRLALENIKKEAEVIVREGLVWDFPTTLRIIPDRRTRQIKGYVGTTRLTEEFDWTVDQIKEMYGVDVSSAGKAVEAHEMLYGRADAPECETLKVRHVYDRKTGLKYCICQDYPDFLAEPTAPDVRVEQFFPFYPLVFNMVEHETEVYPPSDVRLLRTQQVEYNRIKEALRQHRIANRPLYATGAGMLEDEDLEGDGQMALDNYPAHAVLKLAGLGEGEKVADKLQPVQKVNIDPNVYESEGIFTDIQRVGGSQEANLGGTSGNTATESNIAEGSRLSSLESNADDLDGLLTALSRDGGQVLLMEASEETVVEIVGDGAVWPNVTRAEIVKETYLDIEAGSSGRPNRARDIANFKDMGPLLLQIPGQKPEKMARYAWRILDDKADVDDMLDPAAQSIIAMNGQKQVSTGDPSTDPNMQGGEGGSNTSAPPALNGPGPQVPTAAALS